MTERRSTNTDFILVHNTYLYLPIFPGEGKKEVSGFINHDKREPSSSEVRNKILSFPHSPGNEVPGLHPKGSKATLRHWPGTLVYGGHGHVSRREGRPLEKAAGSPPRAQRDPPHESPSLP